VPVKHSSSRELYAYWNARRGTRPAPARADIDPSAIRHSLSDIFILAADFVDEQRFRLAGTRVCALFGRELKGEPFASLWSERTRDHLRALMQDVAGESAGFVAGVTGRNAEGNPIDLELLLVPLAHRGHARVRAIGVLAATELPFWLGARPVLELNLGTVRNLAAAESRPRRLAARLGNLGGQLRRGFMVYQGGAGRKPPAPPAGRAG
jgi:hypothetical protein